jgi:hypothetical protein
MKVKIRFCPKCKSERIQLFVGGEAGMLFECLNCKFRGALFPEREFEINKK